MYSFLNLELVWSSMYSFNCCSLTYWFFCIQRKKICIQISQEVDKVFWYSHLFENFLQSIVIHTVKGFSAVNKTEVDILLELSCYFNNPTDVGNLISDSSALPKSDLNTWKFMVHVPLKSSLENFEYYFASTRVECNCVVVWTVFSIIFLWDWNESWPFPVLWPLLSCPNFLAYRVKHFHSIIFMVWNSSTRIPSPPLILFIVMLPKAHLTSHSRMSGSRWVITRTWLSWSWRSLFIEFFCVFLPPLNIFCFC